MWWNVPNPPSLTKLRKYKSLSALVKLSGETSTAPSDVLRSFTIRTLRAWSRARHGLGIRECPFAIESFLAVSSPQEFWPCEFSQGRQKQFVHPRAQVGQGRATGKASGAENAF